MICVSIKMTERQTHERTIGVDIGYLTEELGITRQKKGKVNTNNIIIIIIVTGMTFVIWIWGWSGMS